mmetsp:Transcript_12000/g.36570  ORF Transcript_12000/g.36570 Transcript_12000/m.36570 type:complete len:648 (-) Transcript_12000:2490-4433(-)
MGFTSRWMLLACAYVVVLASGENTSVRQNAGESNDEDALPFIVHEVSVDSGLDVPSVKHISTDLHVSLVGSIYVGGYTETDGKRDGFVALVTEETIAQYETIGTDADDEVTALTFNEATSTVFVTGFTYGQLPDLVEKKGADFFVVKTGVPNEVASTFQFGSDGNDFGRAITTSADGAMVFVGGQMEEGGFIEPATGLFIAGYSNDLSFKWGDQVGSNKADTVVDLAFDAEYDNLYALCLFHEGSETDGSAMKNLRFLMLDPVTGARKWQTNLLRDVQAEVAVGGLSLGRDGIVHLVYSIDGRQATHVKLASGGVLLSTTRIFRDRPREFFMESVYALRATQDRNVMFLTYIGETASAETPRSDRNADESASSQDTGTTFVSLQQSDSSRRYADLLTLQTVEGDLVQEGFFTRFESTPMQRFHEARFILADQASKWTLLRREPENSNFFGIVFAEFGYTPPAREVPSGAEALMTCDLLITFDERAEDGILGLRQILQEATSTFSLEQIIYEPEEVDELSYSGKVQVSCAGCTEEEVTEKLAAVRSLFESGKVPRLGADVKASNYRSSFNGDTTTLPTPTPFLEEAEAEDSPDVGEEEPPPRNVGPSVAAGVSLGVVGLIVVVSAVFLFWKRRQRPVARDVREAAEPI